MNNIGTLYLAEIKKILSKKSMWIALVLGCAVMVFAMLSNALFDTYEYPDGSKISGVDYYRAQAEKCGKISGRAIDDEFLNEIRDRVVSSAIERGYMTEENLEQIKNGTDEQLTMDEDGFFVGNSPMVALDNAAEQLGIGDCWYFLQNAIDDDQLLMTCNSKEFHKAWRDNLTFNNERSEGSYYTEFRNYWNEKANSIGEPLTYSYQYGYQIFIESAWTCVWLIFLIVALSLAGVFADDRHTRMDALIISSRNGRKPIATAKLAAGFTIAVAEAIIILVIPLAACLMMYSGQGWNAAIQMFIPSCSWNATDGSIICTYFAIVILMAILFASVTMLLSEFMGGAQTLGIQMGVLMIGFFNLPFNNIISHLWDLRPTTFLTAGILQNNYLFQFGTIHLNCVEMAIVLYLIATIACVAVTIASYMKYQVKSR